MKYLKRFNTNTNESLHLSEDLIPMLNSIGDKVSRILLHLSSSGEVYRKDNEINFLSLSNELNKFSFMPLKRRQEYSELNFVKDSMPTKIGRLVQVIWKNVAKFRYFEGYLNGYLQIIHNHSDKDNRLVFKASYEQKHGEFNLLSDNFLFVQHPGLNENVAIRLECSDGTVLRGRISSIEYPNSILDNKLAFIEFTKSKGDRLPEGFFSKYKYDEGYFKLTMKNDLQITESDIEEFVNNVVGYLKSRMIGDSYEIQEVKGEQIRFWYDQENYQKGHSQLNQSCMASKECQPYFDIYCENPDKVSLLILLNNDDELVARALKWKLDDGNCLIDRSYTTLDSDMLIFFNFAKEKGYYHHYKKELYLAGEKTRDVLTVTLENTDFEYYPCLDTLKYFNKKRKTISNRWTLRDGNNLYKADRMDGKIEKMPV
jgi:hypothetical protein